MRKFFLAIIIIIFVINVTVPVFADDEMDESIITEDELNEIIEAAINAINIPKINSRNAIIYDRTSRSSTLWKR